MLSFRPYGSVWAAVSNARPYRKSLLDGNIWNVTFVKNDQRRHWATRTMVVPEDKSVALGWTRSTSHNLLLSIRIFENEVQRTGGLTPFAGFAGFGAIR